MAETSSLEPLRPVVVDVTRKVSEMETNNNEMDLSQTKTVANGNAPNCTSNNGPEGSAKEETTTQMNKTKVNQAEGTGNQADDGQVSKLREIIKEEWKNNTDLYAENDVQKFTSDIYIQRYLRKYDGDEKKALNSLRECLKERKKTGLWQGTDLMVPLEFYKIGAVFPFNEDLDGNPILILRVKFYKKVPELKVPLEDFLFYNMFKVEEMGTKKGGDYGWTLLFDLTDISLSQYDIPFLILVLQNIHKYFPWGLKRAIFYNLPWIVRGAVKVVRAALPKELNAVVHVISKNEIFNFISKENLPTYLGGTCTKNIRAYPEGARSVKIIAQEQFEKYKVSEKRVDEILKIYEPLFKED